MYPNTRKGKQNATDTGVVQILSILAMSGQSLSDRTYTQSPAQHRKKSEVFHFKHGHG